MNNPGSQQSLKKIRIWDAPTRLFHWVTALCFAGAMVTQEMESLRLVHITLGYTMLGLVVFRLLWGLFGTRYARFKQFAPTPGKVISYVRSIATGQPEHFLGHNPLGALAIFAMIGLILGVSLSGILLEQGLNEDLFEDAHELLSNTLLIVVSGHLMGILLSGLIHKERLVPAMINGCKFGPKSQEIHSNYTWIAIALAFLTAYFWLLQLGVI